MRQEFNDLVQKLSTDQYAAVSVIDNDQRLKLLNTTLGSDLAKKHGSVKNYFEQLFSRGTKSLLLQEYRKNGTGWKTIGLPFSVTLLSKQAETSSVATTNQPSLFAGLNGTGLGFAEIMEMNANASYKTKIEAENELLKSKNELLKEQNDSLKEELLKQKYDSENKKSNGDLVLGLVNGLAPVLKGLAEAKTSGLAGTTEQPQFSEKKQQLFNLLKDGNFTDGHADFLLQIIQTINTKETAYEQILNIINQKSEENATN